MKIRKVVEEDTGVYYCKGVNGFGNTQVRVDLIVIGELGLLFESWFHENGSFSVHVFNEHYLAIQQYTGSERNRFQKKNGTRF